MHTLNFVGVSRYPKKTIKINQQTKKVPRNSGFGYEHIGITPDVHGLGQKVDSIWEKNI